MTLKKRFLHADTYFPAISLGRLFAGILIGILFAVSFYSFLYVCREALRILFFLTDDYDCLFFSDGNVYFINFIFACIAVIMGQSICFTFLFDIPLGKFGKRAYQMRAVINDQRSLNTYFLNWFGRLSLVSAMTFGMMGGGMYVLKTFLGYKYVMILIIIVLFLHAWNNIRRLYNGNSLYCMLISAIALLVLSVGISHINLIDYKGVNKIITNKNISYAYNLNLPEAGYFDSMNSTNNRRATLWITNDKSETTEPAIFVRHNYFHEYNDYDKILLDSLKAYFTRYEEDLWEEALYQPCILYIDKNIKMKYIKNIKRNLIELEMYYTHYAVLPYDREFDEKYYTHYAFKLNAGLYYSYDYIFDIQKEIAESKTVIDLRTLNNGDILLDNVIVSRNHFQEYIKQIIEMTPHHYMQYYIDDESTFSDYIFITNNIIQILRKLRSEYVMATYNKEFDELDFEDRKEILNKYMYRVFEVID